MIKEVKLQQTNYILIYERFITIINFDTTVKIYAFNFKNINFTSK